MMKRLNAESTLSLLLVLSLFAMISLSTLRWQSQHQRQTQFLFQQQQALSIAENQIDRQLAQLPCERQVQQNGIRFEVEICNSQQIVVRFPLGTVQIEQGK